MVLLSGPSDLESRQFLRHSSLPVFFGVADDDQYPGMVPATEWLYVITPNPGKKFAHYETGHHGAEIFAVHPDLPVAIVDWYLTTLIKTSGHAPAPASAPAILPEVHSLDLLDQPRGPAKLAQMLFDARQKNPKGPFIPEQVLEGVAYDHLQSKDTKGALEIMKLDAAAYPESPNAYDSLADAYLADGQNDLARQNAQKALELLPSDAVDPQNFKDAIKASAEQKLKQLGLAQ